MVFNFNAELQLLEEKCVLAQYILYYNIMGIVYFVKLIHAVKANISAFPGMTF